MFVTLFLIYNCSSCCKHITSFCSGRQEFLSINSAAVVILSIIIVASQCCLTRCDVWMVRNLCKRQKYYCLGRLFVFFFFRRSSFCQECSQLSERNWHSLHFRVFRCQSQFVFSTWQWRKRASEMLIWQSKPASAVFFIWQPWLIAPMTSLPGG